MCQRHAGYLVYVKNSNGKTTARKWHGIDQTLPNGKWPMHEYRYNLSESELALPIAVLERLYPFPETETQVG